MAARKSLSIFWQIDGATVTVIGISGKLLTSAYIASLWFSTVISLGTDIIHVISPIEF